MYLKQIEEARTLAKPIPHVHTSVDGFPAFVVQYVPELGTGGAAATIAFVQGGSMTFLVDAAAPAGADAIGTAGVINTAAAGYDTVGELIDTINATKAWRAYMVGARRATTMVTILAKTAASCLTANGLTFYLDGSETTFGAIAISGEKFVNYGPNGHVKDADDMCENSLLYLNITCGLTGNGNLNLYSCTQLADGSALAFAMTDDTAITKGNTNLNEPFYTAKLGERLIVETDAATSFDDIAQWEAVGKTAVLSGTRIVTEDNY